MTSPKKADSQHPFPLDQFLQSARTAVIGKDLELKLSLTCLLAKGHLLIEDLPGMGKTTFVLVLSRLLDLPSKRIQFTNDLLPADILGVQILSEDRKSFRFHKGPLFSELVLADELNRGSPKTQSALLQAMEERSVSVDGETFSLPQPFFLIATQNPQEHAGAYPLPESQLDRFMMRIEMGYPQSKDEIEILKRGDVRNQLTHLSPVLERADFALHQQNVASLFCSDALLSYIQTLLHKTRASSLFRMGLSPRCGLLLLQASRAWAYLHHRDHVLPEDVKAVAQSVMLHRLQPQQGSSQQTSQLIHELIKNTPVPL